MRVLEASSSLPVLVTINLDSDDIPLVIEADSVYLPEEQDMLARTGGRDLDTPTISVVTTGDSARHVSQNLKDGQDPFPATVCVADRNENEVSRWRVRFSHIEMPDPNARVFMRTIVFIVTNTGPDGISEMGPEFRRLSECTDGG